MPAQRTLVPVTLALVVGAALGAAAASKVTIRSDLYRGKAPEQAATDLLDVARTLAGTGTYERIAVGRLHYLSGNRAAGQELFDRVLASDPDAGDVIRIARVYREAGEWERARPLFDRVLEMKPKDEDWIAEVGACYLRAGDRERAEELFDRSFDLDPDNLRNALRAAGAYLGLDPGD